METTIFIGPNIKFITSFANYSFLNGCCNSNLHNIDSASRNLYYPLKTTIKTNQPLTSCGTQQQTKMTQIMAINFANATSSGVWYLEHPGLLMMDLLTLLTSILFCRFSFSSSITTVTLHKAMQRHSTEPKIIGHNNIWHRWN